MFPTGAVTGDEWVRFGDPITMPLSTIASAEEQRPPRAASERSTHRLLAARDDAQPNVATPPTIVPFRPLNIPGFSDLPFIGPALFGQTPLTFLAFALFGVVAFRLYRTPLGLAIRAVGENPPPSRRRA